jgi:valyl-tRNA synthetase
LTCVDQALRLIHPFMPYLSEELWQRLPRHHSESAPSICVARYPHAGSAAWRNTTIEEEFSSVSSVVHSIRSLRTEYGIIKRVKPAVVINAHGQLNAGSYMFSAYTLVPDRNTCCFALCRSVLQLG